MEVKNKGKKQIVLFVVIAFLYFLLQLKFVNDTWFDTDELDIMIIGKSIARGSRLYIDLCSQHMPFSYYISALFCKIGAITATQQRMAFYLLIALAWTFIVFNYSDLVRFRYLVLYPIVHCSVIQNYDMGTTILSEQLAGIGAVLIFFEFIRFLDRRNLPFKSMIILSIAVVLTFGTIFVAIYPLFFIAIGVALIEVRWKIQDNVGWKEWTAYLLKKYIPFVIIIAIPWIILLGYYYITHSIKAFIFCAYTLNREIYPQYNGGLGGNIFGTFFGPLEIFSQFIMNGFEISQWTYVNILQWIVVICSILYLYHIYQKYGKMIVVILFAFVYAFGIRGIFNFHGSACVELMAAMVVIVMGDLYEHIQVNNIVYSKAIQIFLYGGILLILAGYLNDISKITAISFKEIPSTQAEILAKITEDDEKIWMTTFYNTHLMMADRTAIGAAVTTPWTWEGFGKKEFQKLKNDNPRVAVLDENHEVWGYNLKDYAPKLIKYIKKNYTQIPGTTTLYVRNDYYNEAMSKIGK